MKKKTWFSRKKSVTNKKKRNNTNEINNNNNNNARKTSRTLRLLLCKGIKSINVFFLICEKVVLKKLCYGNINSR